jgi:zinc/manganese transport system permease protein
VFSSLIMPALAVRHAPARWQLPLAWGAGALAYGLGLTLSAVLDWPSGAVVVLAMTVVCVLLSTVLPHPNKAP